MPGHNPTLLVGQSNRRGVGTCAQFGPPGLFSNRAAADGTSSGYLLRGIRFEDVVETGIGPFFGRGSIVGHGQPRLGEERNS